MTTPFRTDNNIKVEYDSHMGSDADIVRAARVSTVGVELAQEGKSAAPGLINYLMKNRHGSPFEHTAMKFRVEAPIFVFREWMRHRIGFSYNEESGRYKELEPHFYLPGVDRKLKQDGKPGHYTYIAGNEEHYYSTTEIMKQSYYNSYNDYTNLLEEGVAREVARMVLPVGIFSSMYVTANARSIMAFLSLRTEDDSATFPSHPMREIAICAEHIEDLFAQYFPITHDCFVKNGRVSP